MTRKRKLQIASLLLSSGYFLLLLQSPHATRASFIPVIEIKEAEFFARSPENMEGAIKFEDPARLGFFRELLPLSEGPAQPKVVAILRWLAELKKKHTRKEARFSSAFIPEYPLDTYLALVKRGINSGCHNESILIATMLQANGLKARNLDFMQFDGLGGAGHTLSEVWIPEKKKWMLVDGQEAALFFLKQNNEPLSALEVRRLAITLSKEEFYRQVEVLQHPGINDDASTLWEMYRRVSPGFALLDRADSHTTQETIQAIKFSRWVELGGVLPLNIASRLGKLLRSTIGGGGTRLLYVDKHTPHHFTLFWWWLSRAMALCWILTLLTFLPFPRPKANLIAGPANFP